MKQRCITLLLLLLTVGFYAHAQVPAGTEQMVDILDGKRLYFKRLPDNTELQILAVNVKLRQGTTLFYCDSCVINNNAHIFEAFGNVHINDSDTANVWSNYLRYQYDVKKAYLTGNVKLTDGHATLTTSDLDYDVNTKIGTYHNGGRVVNQKSVLTSREGTYYTDIRDIYFKDNVELKDPAYYLKTDSLLYNTESQIARFIAETYIRDSSKRVIRTREGYFDVANNKAEFSSRTVIEDKSLIVTADSIASDDKAGIVQLRNRAVVRDTAQGIFILADNIFVNKKTNAVLATRKPLMIIRQEKDSIYVTADTLFTARLTDLYKNKDSLGLKEKDSTNRYFEAYRHVRVFSDSVQAVSDSMFYSFRDSTFHLYYDPVAWSRKTQMTGDTIHLFTKNKKVDRIKVINNSFMVNEVDPGVYNQIKGNRMEGFFTAGTIDSVLTKGMAESVYFIQDKDSAYSSINQTSSDAMNVYFQKGEIQKVFLRSNVKGTIYPISQKQPSEMHLESFRWLEARRPKTKYELFQ